MNKVRATDFLKRQLLTTDRHSSKMFYRAGAVQSLRRPVERLADRAMQPQTPNTGVNS